MSASIDPAMVIRYFGSKDGLFAQAADFELGLPDLAKIDRRRIGSALVRHFLTIWQRDGGGLATLLRSASSNQYAAQTMRDLFASQIKPALTPICGVHASERAGLVGTQMLGLALCRFILKLPPVATMSDDEVVAWIGPTIQRYVTAQID
jgi:AcrR family transcriptional regulator